MMSFEMRGTQTGYAPPVSYACDESRFPLVIDEGTGLVVPDDLQSYCDRHDEFLARQTPYAAVLHLRPGCTMRAPERRVLAEWLKSRREPLAEHHVAVAIVSGSFLVRAMVTAVYLIAPPAIRIACSTRSYPRRVGWSRCWRTKELRCRRPADGHGRKTSSIVHRHRREQRLLGMCWAERLRTCGGKRARASRRSPHEVPPTLTPPEQPRARGSARLLHG